MPRARRVDRFPRRRPADRTTRSGRRSCDEQAADGSASSRINSAGSRKRGAAREQPVVGIALRSSPGVADDLPVRRRHHDAACSSAFMSQPLSTNSAREPVEQLRMRRRFALRAEVLGGADEPACRRAAARSGSRDARGQRVLGREQPLREPETVRAANRPAVRGRSAANRAASPARRGSRRRRESARRFGVGAPCRPSSSTSGSVVRKALSSARAAVNAAFAATTAASLTRK